MKRCACGASLGAIPPDGVHVENDEGWAFRVGPMFGCVHWSKSK